MTHFAYFDLCFFEQCNLCCTYCRNSNAGFLPGPSQEQLAAVVEEFLRGSQAAILKVSGYGEASIWPDLVAFLSRFRDKFRALQVMTNGTMESEILDKLCSIPNLTFCTTIDGDRLDENQYRSHHSSQLQKTMLSFVETVTSRKNH